LTCYQQISREKEKKEEKCCISNPIFISIFFGYFYANRDRGDSGADDGVADFRY